jgi:hypothetical protein
MSKYVRAVLSASVFLFVASTVARPSECDRRPGISRRAHPPAGFGRLSEAKQAAVRPHSEWRETQVASPVPASHAGCVSLACPGAIVMGVGF